MYIDTNIFIYAIECHPEYGAPCKRILKDVESGKIKVTASILVLVETLNVLNRLNKELKRGGKKLLDMGANISAIESLPITWIDLDFLTIEKAAQYDYAISPGDYFHLAAMELNQINEIISADGGDFDKIKWIARTDPLDYK